MKYLYNCIEKEFYNVIPNIPLAGIEIDNFKGRHFKGDYEDSFSFDFEHMLLNKGQ